MKVIAGNADVFDAVAFGRPNSSIYNFIDQHAQSISQNINQAAQQFFQNTKDIYRKVEESEAVRLAKAVGRKLTTLWDATGINPLTSMAALQHANPDMIRWNMAEPTVREAFNKQQCHGYGDAYMDVHPGTLGEDHYDYRRVMNGVVQLDDDHGWTATTYTEDLLPDDVELELHDQADILLTWDHLKHAMTRKKDDPTSQFNDPL